MSSALADVRPPSPPRRRRPARPELRWALLGALATLLVVALALGAFLAWPRGGGAPGGSDAGDEPEPVRTGELTWAPPELEDPEVIRVSEDERGLRLDEDQDYEIVMPDEPLVHEDGLSIYGGRNVVLVGGRIEAEERALFLEAQTGTVHVEGLSIGGDDLKEGINLDQREGAVVQLQNIHVDRVTGERRGHHADLLQMWAGPETLRIDGLSGETTYQGFMMQPFQFGDVEPEEWDFRRVAITGLEGSAYLMWAAGDDFDWLTVSDVVVDTPGDRPRRRVLEGDLDDVEVGDASSVELPAGEPGTDYQSPGYVQ